MTFNKEELLQDLAELTRINLNEAERLLAHSIEQLNQREAEGKWSVLECMEHLNRYGDFYIPEICFGTLELRNFEIMTSWNWGILESSKL